MGDRDQSAPCGLVGAVPGFESRSRKAVFPVQKLVIGLLRFYKMCVSPLLPSACRYYPTCSEYMLEAVRRHGAARGVWLGLKRLLRCHPFHEGGFDPVR
jgi:putative membrane protein insertion efficiency factor